MTGNSFGHLFQVTTFGESHGPAMGVVIDGCPAGIKFDFDHLQQRLERRRPGRTSVDSARNEADRPEVLSGVFENITLGSPIAIIIPNQDARSSDYQELKEKPRRGHADDLWQLKYGISDHRGGGRASGRETISRVAAGAVAEMFIQSLYPELKVLGWAQRVGSLELAAEETQEALESFNDEFPFDKFPARFPRKNSKEVQNLLESAKKNGQSYGGQARFRIQSLPAGLGRPVFKKLKSELVAACMSVGATSAVEIGVGVQASVAEGSEFHQRKESPYGGIRGGISTGEPIDLLVSFKPTSSVLEVSKKGRHDPCIVPRAIPVIEAMIYLVLVDQILSRRGDRLQY